MASFFRVAARLRGEIRFITPAYVAGCCINFQTSVMGNKGNATHVPVAKNFFIEAKVLFVSGCGKLALCRNYGRAL